MSGNERALKGQWMLKEQKFSDLWAVMKFFCKEVNESFMSK